MVVCDEDGAEANGLVVIPTSRFGIKILTFAVRKRSSAAARWKIRILAYSLNPKMSSEGGTWGKFVRLLLRDCLWL